MNAIRKRVNAWADGMFEKLTRTPLPKKPWDHLYGLTLAALQQRAEGGDAKAAFVLGDIHDQGLCGVTQNLNTAVSWYRRAAELGDGDALNNLGSMHQHGDGLPRDQDRARAYYEQGAAAGCGAAMNNLGHCYGKGRGGLAVDQAAALHWFRAGARHHDGNAMVSLAYAYSHGKGITKSLLRSLYWNRRAAQAGDHKGTYNLGVAYWNGDDVVQDYHKAVALLTPSRAHNHAPALYLLGQAYYEGLGTRQDVAEGLSLLRRAARSGHERAEQYLQRKQESVEPVAAAPASRPALPPVYLQAYHAEQLGNWAEAISAYDQAIPLFDASPELSEDQRMGVRERLAYCLHEAGDYLRAREMNVQVLAAGVRLHGADSPKLMVVLTNLAQNAHALGDWKTARAMLERRLALATEHGDALRVDDSLFQLGVLAFEQGQIEHAHDLMSRRLALAQSSGDTMRIKDAQDALDELIARRDAASSTAESDR